VVVSAFGKQPAASELNYSSDIDLMFLYDEEGFTRSKAGRHRGQRRVFGGC